MRGLIYKDISIFFKSIDKKLILIAAAAIVLLIFNAGIYSGLFASVMFAMTIGMQNIMSFASDEKASWKKYQLAMPISNLLLLQVNMFLLYIRWQSAFWAVLRSTVYPV